MRMTKLSLWAGVLLACFNAHAILITGGLTAGGHTPAIGKLDFDAVFDSLDPKWLTVEIEAGDPGADVAFAADITNESGVAWNDFHIEFAPATPAGAAPFWTSTNMIFPDASVTLSSPDADAAWIVFNDPLTDLDFFSIGFPASPISADDWSFSLNGLAVGDSFLVRLAPSVVPEPATTALMGLALAGLVRRRRRA